MYIVPLHGALSPAAVYSMRIATNKQLQIFSFCKGLTYPANFYFLYVLFSPHRVKKEHTENVKYMLPYILSLSKGRRKLLFA
jgi:hypothetical protein